jgi:ribulose-bisphosphate carboxylase large chain
MNSSESTGPIRSRILRLKPGGQESHSPYAWEGVPVTEYKSAAEHWRGVSRTVLTGNQGESTSFHVRYFELAPGGFTSCEKHEHEHSVVVLRGRGEVQLGPTVHEIHFGDTIYVAPQEPHQFRNPSPTEPFGFLCIVDAQRDRPVVFPGS